MDASEFRELGRRLKASSDGKAVKRGLAKAFKTAAKPAAAEVRKSALASLPSSGGLNAWAATLKVTTKQSFTGSGAGVVITGAKNDKTETVRQVGPLREGERRKTQRRRRAGTFGAVAHTQALNRGRVMHPVYGRGPLVGPQGVRPGFFDRPLQGPIAAKAGDEIADVVADLLRRL